MDGGECEKEEEWVGLPSSLQGIKLVDAPVLFFVVSHKAFRSELYSLRPGAAEAAENGGCNREIVVDLSRRLEFLKLVYNYHCAAEDEVIFMALDQHVMNVMPTYSLEHKSIDDEFRSIFCLLDIFLKKDGRHFTDVSRASFFLEYCSGDDLSSHGERRTTGFSFVKAEFHF